MMPSQFPKLGNRNEPLKVNMDDPIVERYALICNKLKKRFMKKPNITEARNDFYSFGKQLLSEGRNKEYAVMCYVSAAECEYQLGNLVGETNALTKAANLFLQLETDMHTLCIASNEHYLASGIDCYNKAIKKLIAAQKQDLALKLCVEVGCLLIDMGHIPDAEAHFIKASQLINPGNISFQIIILRKLCYCRTYCKNYVGALDTLDQLVSLIQHSLSGQADNVTSHLQDTVKSCECTMLLLLLLINTPFVHLKPQYQKLITKYSTVETDVLETETDIESYMDLVDITMATKLQDFKTLKKLQSKLYKNLSGEQNELMQELVNSTSTVKLVL